MAVIGLDRRSDGHAGQPDVIKVSGDHTFPEGLGLLKVGLVGRRHVAEVELDREGRVGTGGTQADGRGGQEREEGDLHGRQLLLNRFKELTTAAAKHLYLDHDSLFRGLLIHHRLKS